MAGGGGDSGQSMLGGLIGNIGGKGGWQGIIDPGGILMKKPPEQPAFLKPMQGGPDYMQPPQDTDRLAFLRAFGVQG